MAPLFDLCHYLLAALAVRADGGLGRSRSHPLATWLATMSASFPLATARSAVTIAASEASRCPSFRRSIASHAMIGFEDGRCEAKEGVKRRKVTSCGEQLKR